MFFKTTNTTEGIIEYSSLGSGIPILFLHGGHVCCSFTLPHKGFNTQKFHLITPSRPGYGKTPLVENKSPKQAAKLIVALLNELNIDKAIVYGISSGGWTAIEIAGQFPERVDKLILASAVTKKWHDKRSKTYKIAKIIFHPKVEWVTWGLVQFISILSPSFLAKTFFPSLSKANSYHLSYDEVLELVALLKTFRSKSGFVTDIDQYTDIETLRNIKCPTLILHSKNDTSVPISHALYAKKEIKNSTLFKINNRWGHLIWIGDEYQKVKEIILGFIAENTFELE